MPRGGGEGGYIGDLGRIQITPGGTSPPKVYVTNGQANFVTVINATDDTLVKTVPVGDNPFGAAASPDGKRVYVTNWSPLGCSGGNTVSVIDTDGDTVVSTGTAKNQIEVGGGPFGVTVHPDGKRVHVANSVDFPSVLGCTDKTLLPVEDPGQPPGDDQGHTVSVINVSGPTSPKNLTTVFAVDLDPGNTLFPQPIAFGKFIGNLPLPDPECVPLQPLMLLINMEDKIKKLTLRRGLKQMLLQFVEQVRRHLERGEFELVDRGLARFVQQVDRLTERGEISEETAELLVSTAERVENALP